MRKIPSLFIREFEGHNVVNITPKVTPGCEWVLDGEGFATEKLDGTCCLIKDNKIYRRYDAKQGKQPPEGAIPCQPEPDPITTHWPHWVECKENNPADQYHIETFKRYKANWETYTQTDSIDGTYELIGPHFQSNPYELEFDILERHGVRIINVPRSFEAIKNYLTEHYIEGVVFWRNEQGSEMCKIKRTDFGLEWNGKRSKR